MEATMPVASALHRCVDGDAYMVLSVPCPGEPPRPVISVIVTMS